MSSFVTETDSYEENGPLCAIPLKSTLPDELYRYLLYTYESSRNIIKSYNYFIDVILPNIFIGEYEIKYLNSYSISFNFVNCVWYIHLFYVF